MKILLFILFFPFSLIYYFLDDCLCDGKLSKKIKKEVQDLLDINND